MADSRAKATLINSFLTSLVLHAGLFFLFLPIKKDYLYNRVFSVRLFYSNEVSSGYKAFSSTIPEKSVRKGFENTSRNLSSPSDTAIKLKEAKAYKLPSGDDIIPDDSGYVFNVESEEFLDGEGISRISAPEISSPEDGTMTVTSSTYGGSLNNSKEMPFEMVFGSANGPSFLKMVKPEYPKLARRLGKEGRVLLRLHIDETGRLINLEIIERAGYGFDEAALSAIRASRFRPATKDGTPVSSVVYLPVRFVIEAP